MNIYIYSTLIYIALSTRHPGKSITNTNYDSEMTSWSNCIKAMPPYSAMNLALWALRFNTHIHHQQQHDAPPLAELGGAWRGVARQCFVALFLKENIVTFVTSHLAIHHHESTIHLFINHIYNIICTLLKTKPRHCNEDKWYYFALFL